MHLSTFALLRSMFDQMHKKHSNSETFGPGSPIPLSPGLPISPGNPCSP